MAYKSFGREYRERSGFVMWILLVNTVMLSGYVFFAYKGDDAMLFWNVGMSITVFIAAICAVTMYLLVRRDRRQRREKSLKDMRHKNLPEEKPDDERHDRSRIAEKMKALAAQRSSSSMARGAKLARR
jgi:type VI protein secretion system component VasK